MHILTTSNSTGESRYLDNINNICHFSPQDWNPQANKGRFAPSAVEVLRIVDETLEAFFFLPIPMHPVLLPELIGGLDKCLQKYIMKAKSGCGANLQSNILLFYFIASFSCSC